MAGFSEFELKAMALLNTGEYHTKSEFIECLDLDECMPHMVTIYLSRLRTKLEKKGLSIQCSKVPRKDTRFRLVRVLSRQ